MPKRVRGTEEWHVALTLKVSQLKYSSQQKRKNRKEKKRIKKDAEREKKERKKERKIVREVVNYAE